MSAPSERSARARLAALALAAKLTPAERSARAKKASDAATEARRRRRAEEGVPDPKPRDTFRASADELEPYLRELDAEGHSLSYDERIKEAMLRLRVDVAKATHDAVRGLDG